MFFKKVMGVEEFIKINYLPFINEIVLKEFKNVMEAIIMDGISDRTDLEIEPNKVLFELYILSFYLSGRGLSKIRGFENITSPNIIKVSFAENEFLKGKFIDYKLDNKWLDKEYSSEFMNYRKNKNNTYRNIELSFHHGDIDENEFKKQICKTFLSIDDDNIDTGLIEIIGNLHKKQFLYLYQNLLKFSKDYKIE